MKTENTPKVIELKEFVEEAIYQIVQGIKGAQEKTSEFGAILNPRVSNSKGTVRIEDKYYSVQKIEFEVSLANMSGEGAKSAFGVAFGSFGLGINSKSDGEAKSATNIKFSVPIVFPSIDNKEKPKKRSTGRG